MNRGNSSGRESRKMGKEDGQKVGSEAGRMKGGGQAGRMKRKMGEGEEERINRRNRRRRKDLQNEG